MQEIIGSNSDITKPVSPDGRVFSYAPVTDRRTVILGAGSLLLAPSARGSAASSLSLLERHHKGRLGVHVLDLQTGRTFAHRADERFKLMSTFKGILSAMVLSDVALGRDSLDASVPYGASDLMAASPVTQINLPRGEMRVRELCEAIMYRSDNAAANLLMRRAGGPLRLTAFLRRIGDRVTRIDNYEGSLAAQPLPADSSTPHAITQSLRRILLGQVLKPEAQRQWEAWMIGNVVGRTRLRAGFPTNWTSGDRTGTGDGICNDFAFARRPGRAPLLLSVYYDSPGLELTKQEAVLRQVAHLATQWQRTV